MGSWEDSARGLATPLVASASVPAGSHQQVMSPTLGQGHCGTLGNMPSPPPGRDGHPGSQDATQTPAQVHAAGGVGFASDTHLEVGTQQKAHPRCRPPLMVGLQVHPEVHRHEA